ncbi:MAG TPA: glycosyltransferase family 2 protein [Gemmatimonadales bacterium]|nr:glycosyltransferase family 2 protein [Gemmatimonadales bacterium]
MTPRVSVVSTVYNGEPYFDRAIPGILAQTYDDFEFIVVDDGSDDRTPALLREVASQDPRVRLFSPGRLGAAAAYNYGTAQALGEYVARQDFDDTSYPERLRLQVQRLDAEPELGVVGGHYVLVDESRGERYVRMPPLEHTEIVRAMARYIPLAHTVATFRRKAWEQAGGYPLVGNLIDLRFWLRVIKLGWRFANVPELVGEHYVHWGSFFFRSLDYVARQRDLARVQAQIIRELGLPPWMYLYPLGRYGYAHFPQGLKRVLRRSLGSSSERDL